MRHDLGQCFLKLILRPFHTLSKDKNGLGQNVAVDEKGEGSRLVVTGCVEVG